MSFATAYCLSDMSERSHAGGLSSDGYAGGLESDIADACSWQDEFADLEKELGLEPPVAPRASESVLLNVLAATANRKRLPSAPTQPSNRPCGVAAVVSEAAATGSQWGRAGPLGSAEPPPKTTGDMGQGMNMDKRRCRQLHRDDFMAGIATYREQQQQHHRVAVHREQQQLQQQQPSQRPSQPSISCDSGVAGWVRKRPLLAHEAAKAEYDALSVGDGTVTTHTCLMKPDLRRMFLRHAAFAPSGGVFDEGASSSEVYAGACEPLVEMALRGGRGTIVMYGQTGSGKTMSLAHIQQLAAAHLFREAPPPPGTARSDPARPRRALSEVQLRQQEADAALAASWIAAGGPRALAVEVTAVEVAGKKCIDLHTKAECQVLQTAQGGAALKGVTPYVATSAAALGAHLERVLRSRTTEATAVNATSSRSHALITLRVAVDGFRPAEGQLTLLDCAGSEWAADSSSHDAKRRAQGAEINASLHALKKVVRAHADRLHAASKGVAFKGHVPYREAVLTRLLRDSFEAEGAKVRLAMIGCVSPGAADAEHSTSTLRTLMELAAAKHDEECTVSTQDVPRLKALAAAAAAAESARGGYTVY